MPADAASGAASPRIDSVAPAAAERGHQVELLGGGFGAQNVTVRVGGVSAQVLAATGNRVLFRVPPTAPFGATEVEAVNPGGLKASAPFTVLGFDGQVDVDADESAAVAAPIGAAGGTITVEGMQLTVPAGALPEDTTITATPLRALGGSPFAAAPVGLKLEPSGLVLLQPATLTLPAPAGGGLTVGFGFDGDGDSFHLVPQVSAGDTASVKVWHFSGAGVLPARLDELEAALSYEPAPAHQLAEQRIAAALVDAQVTGSDPGPAIAAALALWRRSSVTHGLDIAGSTAQLAYFELAFGEWLAWLAYLQEYRDTIPASDASFFDRAVRDIDRPVATNSAAAVARRQLDRCLGPDLPRAALRDVIRVASAVNLAALPIEDGEFGTARPLPAGPDLPSACVDVEIVSIEHAAVFARNRNNLLSVRAQVVFWSSNASTSIPLRYRLAGIATEVTSTGRYTVARRPAELGTDEFQLTVDLDTTGTDTVLRTIYEQRSISIPVRERLELHARRSGDPAFTDTIGTVTPGSAVTLRIRLAGDNVADQTITLGHEGGGTLPATATTNALGEATVTYTAPAGGTTELIELVTATINDNGLTTGDAVSITTRPAITVTVTPSFGFASPGGTVQFTAGVAGTTDQRVTWSVSGGGTISDTGLFTASSSAADGATFDVVARSVADPTSFGGASVQIVGEDVTGRYVGTVCTFNDFGDEDCLGGFVLDYACFFQSEIHPGTTCGWVSRQGLQQVPWRIPLCFIETDGTTAGGAFTARVTSCSFRPASVYADTRIEGTIGRGRLEIQVYTPDFETGGSRLSERISMTKAP